MDALSQRIDSYRFFTFLFIAVPDDNFVTNIMSLGVDNEADSGMLLLQKFIETSKSKTIEQIKKDITVDRTHLIRGLTPEGPRPPYESVYTARPPQEVLYELNKHYSNAGFTVSEDTHEPADYIGTEISFMQELCTMELYAIAEKNADNANTFYKAQKEFFNNHLGLWGEDLGKEFIAEAKTDFYRAIGHILAEFMQDEKEYYS